jgi:hypothetical protein
MAGYQFSPVDVWLMNVVEEGYRFDEVCRVSDEWVEEIMVWEGLWYIVPACKLRITDFGMNYLSYRSIGNVVVSVGLDRSKMVMFDMAVASVRDTTLEHTIRPTAVSMTLMGYGMPGVWLLGKGFKGYGEKSASKVVKEFVEDVVLSNYVRICSVLKWGEEVQDSYDKKYYLQGGRSGFSFLGYLRDCARSRYGEQDYFVWFSPVVNANGSNGLSWKLNFRSFSEMKKQDVKCYLEYVIDPKKWDEAWENYGYLKEEGVKVVPFMWYEIVGRSIVSDTMKTKFVKYGFDLTKLAVNRVVVDKVSELLGKKVKSNVIASVLSKVENMVTEVVNEGGVDAIDKTFPDTGIFYKCRMMRKWCVVVPGVVDLEVGDKVRVLFADGYGDFAEALSGEWLVGEIVHLWSNPGRNYLKKLVLVSEAWKNERRGYEEIWIG